MKHSAGSPARRDVTDDALPNAVSSSDDPRLVQALEEYADAVEAGRPPDLQEFQSRHPAIATQLAECLEGLEFVQAAAAQLAHPASALGGKSTGGAEFWPAEALGDYRIVREVGRGGMGVVYEAVQISLGRRVALKVLPFASALDAKQLQRFKNEAQAAAQLHHQNIVPVYGVGCERGVHYYAMQFIDGQTLSALVGELRARAGRARCGSPAASIALASLADELVSGRWTQDGTGGPSGGIGSPSGGTHNQATVSEDRPAIKPGAARESDRAGTSKPTVETTARQTVVAVSGTSTKESAYFRTVANLGVQAATALEHAHALGIVHRDVKPANLLLDARGILWVTDFGLAHCHTQAGLTMTGDVLGTLRYMSPEQALARRTLLDHRTDVYSLGATLYELLTLEPVFDCQERQELLRQIAAEDPRRPRGLNAAIPFELETIVLKALEKDPSERYATAHALADDLSRFLKDEPIRARPPTVVHKIRKWARRHRGVVLTAAAMSTLLLVAVTAVASLAAWRLNGEREATRHQLLLTQRAEADTTDKLWGSYLAQARGGRLTRQPGQRFDSLRAVREALKLPLPRDRSLDELRAEAIACLCVTDDLEVAKGWDGCPTGTRGWAIDDAFERYARGDNQGNVSVRRIADDRELLRLPGDGSQLNVYGGLEFSPDGRFLHQVWPVDGGHRARLWRLDQAPPIVALDDDHINLSFRSDSRQFAAAYPDGSLRIFDTETAREVRRFANILPQADATLRWNPRLGQLALLTRTVCRVIEVDSGEIVRDISVPGGGNWIDWHPVGQVLAISSDDLKIYLYEVARGRLVLPPLEGHKRSGVIIRFNHAGDRLVSNDWAGILRLWDTRTGRQLLAQPGYGTCLAFSRDDRLLAGEVDAHLVRLFRCHTSHEIRTVVARSATGRFMGHPVWARDGRLLAQRTPYGVALVDTLRCEEIATLPLSENDHPLYFEPRDDALWTSGSKGLLRWPLRTSAGGGRLQVGPPQTMTAGTCPDASAASADGQTVCTPQRDQGALLWRRRPDERVILGPQQDVQHAAVSPDGKWVVTGSHSLASGSGAKVWDAATGRYVADLPVSSFCQVRFSPDGRWLVTTGGGPRIWAVGAWQEGPKLGGTRHTWDVCFTADSQLLALEGSPSEVLLVRPETGVELARLTAPEQTRLVPHAFTPDGTRLVTLGTETGALHIFDLSSIRAQLVPLGLDWDASPLPPSPASDVEPLEVEVDPGNSSAPGER